MKNDIKKVEKITPEMALNDIVYLMMQEEYKKLTNMINADSINYSPPKTLSNKEIVRLLNEIKNGR